MRSSNCTKGIIQAVVLLGAVVLCERGALAVTGPCVVDDASVAIAPDSNIGHYSPQFPGYLHTYFRVPRVVGPGTPSEYNDNAGGADLIHKGTLVNIATYKQNGIVSDKAYVQLSTTLEVGPQFWALTHADGSNTAISLHVSVQFTLNGVKVGDVVELDAMVASQSTSIPPVIVTQCAEVSTEFVRFGRKFLSNNKSAYPCPAGTPPFQSPYDTETTCPGINEVEATFTSNLQNWDLFLSTQGAHGDLLVFKALAPIVMLHGWRSGPYWFGPLTPDPNICPADPDHLRDFDHGDRDPHGTSFVAPLVLAKAPFDCSIYVQWDAPIDSGGAKFAEMLLPVLNSFGAKQVHLIAHSKGTLWIREALPQLLGQIQVLSFTTLNGYHHGTVLADYLNYGTQIFKGKPWDFRFFPSAVASSFFRRGTTDLTVNTVAAFNTAEGTANPPVDFPLNGHAIKAQYFAVSSDADLNHDHQITSDEWAPYPQYGFFPGTQQLSWTALYNLSGSYAEINPNTTQWIPIRGPNGKPVSPPQANDLFLAISKSQYDSFTPLPGPPAQAVPGNHNSIAKCISIPDNCSTAQMVFNKILSTQKMQ